jgi:hypothetical protein
MSEQDNNTDIARRIPAGLPSTEMPVNDWQAMGQAFDGLCKAGLALTVGFSVAAAFCKMMDTRKVDISSFVNRMAGVAFNPAKDEPDKPH